MDQPIRGPFLASLSQSDRLIWGLGSVSTWAQCMTDFKRLRERSGDCDCIGGGAEGGGGGVHMNNLLREMGIFSTCSKESRYLINASLGAPLHGMTIPVGIVASGICAIEFESL